MTDLDLELARLERHLQARRRLADTLLLAAVVVGLSIVGQTVALIWALTALP